MLTLKQMFYQRNKPDKKQISASDMRTYKTVQIRPAVPIRLLQPWPLFTILNITYIFQLSLLTRKREAAGSSKTMATQPCSHSTITLKQAEQHYITVRA
jgi:hypothetical protein